MVKDKSATKEAEPYSKLATIYDHVMRHVDYVHWATYVESLWMLPVALGLLGASISACIPAQNLILSFLSGSGRKGKAFGLLMGVMTLANSVGPLLFGIAADRIGLGGALRLFAGPAIVSALLVAALVRMLAFRGKRWRLGAQGE